MGRQCSAIRNDLLSRTEKYEMSYESMSLGHSQTETCWNYITHITSEFHKLDQSRDYKPNSRNEIANTWEIDSDNQKF
jgi:hypothetical protein